MIVEFLHFAGIIIGLGAVTVIDSLGFFSRNSKKLTPVTIEAHHITKPLIWIGTLLLLFSWLFIFDFSLLSWVKSFLILVLILNGSFLSFYISPKLDKLRFKEKVLDAKLQRKILVSMLISFVSWWSLVWITVRMLT